MRAGSRAIKSLPGGWIAASTLRVARERIGVRRAADAEVPARKERRFIFN
jgi:hypothetical protein